MRVASKRGERVEIWDQLELFVVHAGRHGDAVREVRNS